MFLHRENITASQKSCRMTAFSQQSTNSDDISSALMSLPATNTSTCSPSFAGYFNLVMDFLILNVISLLQKMELVRIWVKSTGMDVVIISETWLSKSINNEDINIFGYNLYRSDRPKKDGGVAIYVKSRFNTSIVLSQSICKQMEFLALNVEIAKSLSIAVVGCYRPPSASKAALYSIKDLLAKLSYTEIWQVI